MRAGFVECGFRDGNDPIVLNADTRSVAWISESVDDRAVIKNDVERQCIASRIIGRWRRILAPRRKAENK